MLQRQKDIRRLQGGGGCIDRGTSEDQGAAETEGHKKTAGGGGCIDRGTSEDQGAAETEGRQWTSYQCTRHDLLHFCDIIALIDSNNLTHWITCRSMQKEI